LLLLFRVWRVLELGRLVSWNWGLHAHTGLNGELHRPEQCGAFSGNCQVLLGSPSLRSRVTRCVSRGSRVFWRLSSENSSRTGLTGAGDRCDWCGLWLLELLVPLHSRVGFGGCCFLGPVALLREEFLSAPIHSSPLYGHQFGTSSCFHDQDSCAHHHFSSLLCFYTGR
jgi:hypothetical protein